MLLPQVDTCRVFEVSKFLNNVDFFDFWCPHIGIFVASNRQVALQATSGFSVRPTPGVLPQPRSHRSRQVWLGLEIRGGGVARGGGNHVRFSDSHLNHVERRIFGILMQKHCLHV